MEWIGGPGEEEFSTAMRTAELWGFLERILVSHMSQYIYLP